MKTFFQAETYTEQRQSILDTLEQNNGKATWSQLRGLSISPSLLGEHLRILQATGKIIRQDSETGDGMIITVFRLRRRVAA